MEILENLVLSGRICDIALALMGVEATALIAYRRATGRGIATGVLIANFAAGAALVLALRSALTGAHWTVTAAWLAASLVAHIADLKARWP